MAFFRSIPKLQEMLKLFSRDESWLICINADPDAMASAMALKRIMSRRVKNVTIAKINELRRPDNLAMVRYTRLDLQDLDQELIKKHDRYATVDSQPHHNKAFEGIPFSLIIDHHPLPEEPFPAQYKEIMPEYGATSTMMTEYLYGLKIRPGKLLATALQFGIKTDTNNFERNLIDVDIRAFQYLSKFSDNALLSRIARSEFHLDWLQYFAKACNNMYSLGSGQISYVGEVANSEILVNIADFFMRVYELRWVAVGALYKETVIVVFRSDGIVKDVGKLASELFDDLGSAGGHKTMARAEFPVELCGTQNPEIFVWRRFKYPAQALSKQELLEKIAEGEKASSPAKIEDPEEKKPEGKNKKNKKTKPGTNGSVDPAQ